MYQGYNKISINELCSNCRNKITEVNGMTIGELHNAFYTDPRFADRRHDHSFVNSIIVATLLDQHDCTRCLDRIYARG